MQLRVHMEIQMGQKEVGEQEFEDSFGKQIPGGIGVS